MYTEDIILCGTLVYIPVRVFAVALYTLEDIHIVLYIVDVSMYMYHTCRGAIIVASKLILLLPLQ